MNSVHDMGGTHGFGAVLPENDEPVFHAPWERQALALTLAMGATGLWNLDQGRHARESLPPLTYLSLSYYEIWLAALKRLTLAHGLVSEAEWSSGQLHTPGLALPRVLQAHAVDEALAKGSSVERAASAPPKFEVGQPVLTRLQQVLTHTRLPRYARGRRGVVTQVHGHHVLADANAHRSPTDPEVAAWLYAVRFEAKDLWGESADPNASVQVDLWETHLLPAEASV